LKPTFEVQRSEFAESTALTAVVELKVRLSVVESRFVQVLPSLPVRVYCCVLDAVTTRMPAVVCGVGVGVDVLGEVGVLVAIAVGVSVEVGVLVGALVGVGVGVTVHVGVAVGVEVGTGVGVAVEVRTGVAVGVDVGVTVNVGVAVDVGAGMGVGVRVTVGVMVAGTPVDVGVGVFVVAGVLVTVDVGVGVSVGLPVGVDVGVAVAVGITAGQLGNRNDATRVLQLNVPLAFKYSLVYQKVQSSTGSTDSAL
jgi:hypothetical protein